MKLLLALSGIITSVTMGASSSSTDVDPVKTKSTTPSSRSVVATSASTTSGVLPSTHPVLRPMRATNGTGVAYTRETALVRGMTIGALDDVVQQYCAGCHNPTQRRGNLDLKKYSVVNATGELPTSEKIIRKLRAQMMPPPGSKRPTGDTLAALVETLERVVDGAAPVNPGTRTFQRLNRPEYERVIRDLLGLEVTSGDWLPLDTKSANFDNISDVQSLSPTLLEGYLNAAAAVSRMAIGDRKAPVGQATYKTSPFASQHPWDHVDGTPYGTRGGLVLLHTFPADGEYEFRLNVGGGVGRPVEDLDISIDGERVALLRYDRGIARNGESADAPLGADFIRSEPIKVKAGQRKVSVAFAKSAEGPYEDLIKPHEWSRASSGTGAAGTTEPPPLMEVFVAGPYRVTGVSDSPSRKRIFSCAPTAVALQRACAEQIFTRLGTRAYRRPLTANDKASLMKFYDQGAKNGGDNAFEEGVRLGLQAMLASPYFVFRFEKEPTTTAAGTDYKIDDLELATRLSFFLWSTIPDDRLLATARAKTLHTPAVFQAQVKRMLADPRADALATRFAAQWLRLSDIEKVHPDALQYPDYREQLASDMVQETEMFFDHLVRENRSFLDLYTANWTYVNEGLAKHYGIPGVVGTEFRRVQYPASSGRVGIFGHGSVLTLTSHANRTSPVLRGKWVMEVLMGTPPPAPPPNVPDLEKTGDSKEGRLLTTRERMEEHRANPSCRSCHVFIDPIGLAMDNFDVNGQWRIRENGTPLDTRGDFYDGTKITNALELQKALLKRPTPLVRNFTQNLMAYALGRRVEYYDHPAVRKIEAQVKANNYRMQDFIVGVVKSDAFRLKKVMEQADSGTKGASAPGVR